MKLVLELLELFLAPKIPLALEYEKNDFFVCCKCLMNLRHYNFFRKCRF